MTLPSFTLSLPMPPSVNAMYVNRSKSGMRGRMISKEYAAWRKEADGALWRQKPLPSFPGKVAVLLVFQQPKGLRDLDGCIKPVLDYLVRHAIIKEDNHKYVRMIMLSWDASIEGCRVTISEMSEG